MSRYFIRRAPTGFYVENDFYSASVGPLQTPCVPDHEATDTGLLDSSGDPIMRAPNPMGFGRDGEW
jgi:hypothetical protein